ncbi:MAG: hypothetical protein A2Z91_06120 [Deltaproteobacteria bacterium GWA2_38_16]|nr:MAG: hypothetical protein A2Z91_06120 [Deltaproteobacteria bacterium GWA2_38_16]OGQ03738.1 MAG: hypothetical protein A3D19_02690 [Deltaproteobacteria bacterium RIFCSPHIGHO2_02_FULL_38_15]OGQ61960.1 MAG: hypothetical protein A3G92_06965 [Deltaproteobacteria bacterium RIFCSPLOWO2_12_FULL_38_8]
MVGLNKTIIYFIAIGYLMLSSVCGFSQGTTENNNRAVANEQRFFIIDIQILREQRETFNQSQYFFEHAVSTWLGTHQDVRIVNSSSESYIPPYSNINAYLFEIKHIILFPNLNKVEEFRNFMEGLEESMFNEIPKMYRRWNDITPFPYLHFNIYLINEVEFSIHYSTRYHLIIRNELDLQLMDLNLAEKYHQTSYRFRGYAGTNSFLGVYDQFIQAKESPWDFLKDKAPEKFLYLLTNEDPFHFYFDGAFQYKFSEKYVVGGRETPYYFEGEIQIQALTEADLHKKN